MNEQPILLMENITKVYSNGFVANQDFSRYSFYNNSGVTEVDDDEL